jgi:hypothetical protein
MKMTSRVWGGPDLGRKPAVAALLLSAVCACSGPPGDEDVDDVDVVRTKLITPSPTIHRVIPVRFIQFYAPGNPGQQLPLTALQTRIDEANATYAKAGLQFVIRSFTTKASAFFADQTSAAYTWPTTAAQAVPVQDLGCSTANYNALLASIPSSRVEPRTPPAQAALFRAGAYCAPDGETLIYIVNTPASLNLTNTPRWGKTMVLAGGSSGYLNRAANTEPGVFSHELGHRLGLMHTFETPETGSWVDAWDLVYGPPNTFFGSRGDAALWTAYNPGQALMPLDTQLLERIRYCTAATSCSVGEQVPGSCSCPPANANCGAGKNGTGDIRSSTGGVFYTGDGPLKGLAAKSGSLRYVNAMSYWWTWCYFYNSSLNMANFKLMISDSQAEIIKNELTQDRNLGTLPPASHAYPGAWSRHNRLGVGDGFWTEWIPLDIASTRPGTASKAGHAYATSTRSDGFVAWYDVSISATPAITEELVGNSAKWRSDVALVGSGGTANTQVVATASPNADGLHNLRSSSGTWAIPGAWGFPGGQFLGPLVATGRTNGALEVVGKGLDGHAYMRTRLADGSWSPANGVWQYIGGPVAFSPAIGTRPDQTIDMVALDTSGHIKFKSRTNAGTWSPGLSTWTTISDTSSACGTGLFGEPSMSQRPGGETDVIARCASQPYVCRKTRATNGTWSPSTTGWDCLYSKGPATWGDAAGIVGVPSIASWGSGRIDMVARTANGSVAYRFYNPTTSSWWPSSTEWANLGSKGTTSESDPVIVATGTNNLAIFRVADDGLLYVRVRYQ